MKNPVAVKLQADAFPLGRSFPFDFVAISCAAMPVVYCT